MSRRPVTPAAARAGAAAPPAPERSTLLTADELGQRWQVRAQHVYALAREGGLPHVRIGRYVRFRLASVEAWEQQQEDSR